MEEIKKYINHRYTHLTIFIFFSIILILKNHLSLLNFMGSISLDNCYHFLAFFFLSSFVTIFLKEKITNKYPETTKGITYISWIFLLCLTTIYILYYNYGTEYQSTIALLVSSVLLGSGWWVQATISKVAARKAHTLNTLMNQRNSELFNKKISNVTSIFGAGKTVNEIIAKHRLIPEHKDLENKTIHSDKKTAANDLIYILNYYEFICAGINNGDFDENSMKECLSNIIPTLEIRSFHFIKLSREIAGKECFDNIVRVSNKWSKNGGSIIMKYENGEQITNLTHCFSEDECYTKLLQN